MQESANVWSYVMEDIGVHLEETTNVYLFVFWKIIVFKIVTDMKWPVS